MRIAILSDLHIGYERFRKDAFSQAKEALEKACDSADAIIIPGDIFDTRTPKPDVLAEAIVLFNAVKEKKFEAKIIDFHGSRRIYTTAPVLAIPGTHERRTDDVEDPVDLLNLTSLVADIGMGVAVLAKGDEKVAVTGISGVAEERFGEALKSPGLKPVEGAFNILMFHQSIYELLPFSDTFLRMSELPKGFDLYVNGHIHNKVEKMVHGVPFLIPGSTVLTQLKEGETEKKGFFIYDTETGKHEFIRINSRGFEIIKIDAGEAAGEGELAAHVAMRVSEIVSRLGKGCIIRIEVTGNSRHVKRVDMELHEAVKRFRDDAVIEIARKGIEGVAEERDLSGAKGADINSMPVKEIGMGILLSALKKSGYDLKISPTELFERLGSPEKKEKVISEVMKALFE